MLHVNMVTLHVGIDKSYVNIITCVLHVDITWWGGGAYVCHP